MPGTESPSIIRTKLGNIAPAYELAEHAGDPSGACKPVKENEHPPTVFLRPGLDEPSGDLTGRALVTSRRQLLKQLETS